MHQEPQLVGVVAGYHLVAILEQPLIAVTGITGEDGVEGQAGRNLFLQWSVRLATMHHHFVLHHHPTVVDRRQNAFGVLSGPSGQ